MNRIAVRIVLAGTLAAAPAFAQGNPPGTVTVSSAVNVVQQGDATLDAGGTARWSGATVSAGVTRQFVPAFAAGVLLRHDDQTWTVAPGTALGTAAPWRHLRRTGGSVNTSLALSRTLLVGVSPTAEWAYDEPAGTGDAAIYGAVVSAVKVVSPGHVLGAGASVTRQFYDVKTSPFVIVNWKLTDRWRIANAPGAGPLGGAGVELRYAPSAAWEFAAGGVSRSDRWRLATRHAGAGDVGETSAFPVLARVTRTFGARARLDVHGGAMLANRLTVKDSDGRIVARSDADPAAALGLTFSMKF